MRESLGRRRCAPVRLRHYAKGYLTSRRLLESLIKYYPDVQWLGLVFGDNRDCSIGVLLVLWNRWRDRHRMLGAIPA